MMDLLESTQHLCIFISLHLKKKKEEDYLNPFPLFCLISKMLSNLCKKSYGLVLSIKPTNYINKANMIIVYVLSVSHSIHMHKD